MTFHGKTYTNGFPLNGWNANIKSLRVRRVPFKIQRLQTGVFGVDSLSNNEYRVYDEKAFSFYIRLKV